MFPTNFSEAVKTGFLPYILEANGESTLISTRTAKINAIIKDFKYIVQQGKDPNLYIDDVLAGYGLTEDMLTEKECERIMGYVNGLY